MGTTTTNRKDVYQMVADRIVQALEDGTVPWRKPWNIRSQAPMNLISKKAYRGMNVFLLAMTAYSKGYSSPYWLTYKQAQKLGGNVRKGEKSTFVVFWKWIERVRKDEDGEEQIDRFPYLRYYNVFNVEQTENIDESKIPSVDDETWDHDPIEAAEQIWNEMPNPPKVTRNGFARAFYRPTTDEIELPDLEHYEIAEEFYSTLFHELVHSTGHKSRLNRDEITNPNLFGSEPYGREELVGEMGAAMLSAVAGIENNTLDNSAAYINGWIEKIKGDPKMVVTAAARAQKAADFILGESAKGDDSGSES
jgi:antirestriction protein ArdC